MNRYLLIGFVIVLTLAGTACGPQGNHSRRAATANASAAENTPAPVPVEVGLVEMGEITDHIETTGNIEAKQDVTLYPKTSGQVHRILVEEGDRVKKDQIVAVLDDDAVQLRERRERVAMLQAKEKFQRTKSMYDAQMVSEETYRDAEYAYQNAEIAFELAQLDLEHTRIKSPIEGQITERYVSIGDLIQMSTPLFRIVNPVALEVNIFLPEHEVYRLQPGMDATIRPESLSNIDFTASLARISPVVDPKTGTVKVTLDVEDPQHQLTAGMFVRTKIMLERKPAAVLVPKTAIIRDNGDVFVYLMNSLDRAERRKLITGLENARYLEVLDGVAAGDRLIVVGQHGLENDAPVYLADDLTEGTANADDLAPAREEPVSTS